ncbi:MAG: glycosyltransferase family 4 protein, partial [Candidatus Nitrosotenuis sp.]
FEVDTISQREKHHLNYSDYIFVASKWAKTVLENNGVSKPVYVAPLGVDTTIFQEPVKIRMERDNYVFFHVGKWEHRKSQDFLLKAFDHAFNLNDNVELWMLPYNPFLNEQENQYWINLVNECKLRDKIKLFNRLPSQLHLAEFMYYGDCGIFVSRAEGWNNEVIETMAMNRPVIVTNYSAHTEYCNDKNSLLVHVDETEPANDGKWFFGEGSWAKLGQNELDQTVHYMKHVYNNRIDNNPEGLKTAQYYSWLRTSQTIDNTLTENNSYANS